jgi:hypothetical protein
MKKIHTLLILLVGVVVLSAWTYRLDSPSVFRGGEANSMLEEFAVYGLNKTTMTLVGIAKVLLSIVLLIGLKFRKLVTPAALGIALFMIAAVYFHLSVGDALLPTLPSALMLISCLTILYIHKKVFV